MEGNECGLDFEGRQPCAMEAAGHPADFYTCPFAQPQITMLEVARRHIHFNGPGMDRPVTLERWMLDRPKPGGP